MKDSDQNGFQKLLKSEEENKEEDDDEDDEYDEEFDEEEYQKELKELEKCSKISLDYIGKKATLRPSYFTLDRKRFLEQLQIEEESQKQLNTEDSNDISNHLLSNNKENSEKKEESKTSSLPTFPSRLHSSHSNIKSNSPKLTIGIRRSISPSFKPSQPAPPPKRSSNSPLTRNSPVPLSQSLSTSSLLSSSSLVLKISELPDEIQNLIISERSFVNKLLKVQEIFLIPIRRQKILSSFEIVSLFANFEEILSVHKLLLRKMESMRYSFADIFLNTKTLFQPYVIYTSNLPYISDLFSQFKSEHSAFSDLIDQNNGFNLLSILRSPHLRLSQYPKYIKDIISLYSNEREENEGRTSSIFTWGNGKEEVQRVNGEEHWSQIENGGSHFAVLSLGNSVYVWGRGKDGQLGLGFKEVMRESPTLVPLYYPNSSPIKIVSINCGPLQTAAISDKGELYLWGLIGNKPIFEPEKQIFQSGDEEEEEERKVIQVSLSPTCVYAILSPKSSTNCTNNEVWVWGTSYRGMLGIEGVSSLDTPTLLSDLTPRKIIQISSGELHVAALTSSGEIYTWGVKTENSIEEYHQTPQLVISLLRKEIIQICCGYAHTFALSKSGQLYCWGYAKHGVLGVLGVACDSDFLSSPSVVPLPNQKIKRIVSGGMHSILLDDRGVAYSWGQGRGFVTGQGNENDILQPTMIKSLAGYLITHISAGSSSNIAYSSSYSSTFHSIHLLEDSLFAFNSLVAELKKEVESAGNIAKILLIVNTLLNPSKYKLLDKKYVKDGKVKVNGKTLYVIVFEDMLILCRLPKKTSKNKLFQAFDCINFNQAILSDIDTEYDQANSRFEIGEIGKEVFSFSFRSSLNKTKWFNTLSFLIKQFDDHYKKSNFSPYSRRKQQSKAKTLPSSIPSPFLSSSPSISSPPSADSSSSVRSSSSSPPNTFSLPSSSNNNIVNNNIDGQGEEEEEEFDIQLRGSRKAARSHRNRIKNNNMNEIVQQNDHKQKEEKGSPVRGEKEEELVDVSLNENNLKENNGKGKGNVSRRDKSKEKSNRMKHRKQQKFQVPISSRRSHSDHYFDSSSSIHQIDNSINQVDKFSPTSSPISPPPSPSYSPSISNHSSELQSTSPSESLSLSLSSSSDWSITNSGETPFLVGDDDDDEIIVFYD